VEDKGTAVPTFIFPVLFISYPDKKNSIKQEHFF